MNEQHIIAEFMGLTYEEKTITAPHGSGGDITYTVYYDDSREVYLKYKYSWDALIPVVSEIYDLYEKFELNPDETELETDLVHELHYTLSKINIESTYKAVIKCIEFYNKVIK